MLIAYNRYRASEYHHRFSATENAYPSPRSWAMTDRVLQLGLPEDLERECVAGTVGGPAGADFGGFQRIFQSLPDVDAIVSNPDGGTLPGDPMTAYALMGASRTGQHRAILRRSFATWTVCRSRSSRSSAWSTRPRDEQLMLTTAYQTWAAAHGSMLT